MIAQPDLFDQAPTRIQDCTLQDWDWKRPALARKLFAAAPACVGMAWWDGIIASIRASNKARGVEYEDYPDETPNHDDLEEAGQLPLAEGWDLDPGARGD